MGEVSPLNQLYARYRDRGFEFLTIYVREPHPGEHYGSHASWEQKVEYARQCRAQDGIENPLLVDGLEGMVHCIYGALPNMVYIVDKQGKIAYRATWTDHEEIEAVLQNLALADELRAQGARLRSSYSERVSYTPVENSALRQRVFDRAGPKAGDDYRVAFRPQP